MMIATGWSSGAPATCPARVGASLQQRSGPHPAGERPSRAGGTKSAPMLWDARARRRGTMARSRLPSYLYLRQSSMERVHGGRPCRAVEAGCLRSRGKLPATDARAMVETDSHGSVRSRWPCCPWCLNGRPPSAAATSRRRARTM